MVSRDLLRFSLASRLSFLCFDTPSKILREHEMLGDAGQTLNGQGRPLAFDILPNFDLPN